MGPFKRPCSISFARFSSKTAISDGYCRRAVSKTSIPLPTKDLLTISFGVGFVGRGCEAAGLSLALSIFRRSSAALLCLKSSSSVDIPRDSRYLITINPVGVYIRCLQADHRLSGSHRDGATPDATWDSSFGRGVILVRPPGLTSSGGRTFSTHERPFSGPEQGNARSRSLALSDGFSHGRSV